MSPETIIAATRQTGFAAVEPGSFRALPLRAALFISLVVATGAWLLARCFENWNPAEPLQFLFYLVIAIIASLLKIGLPTVNGSMSINFFFILIGLVDLSLPETMAIACAGAVTQNLFKPRQAARFHQVLFNIATVAITVAASYGVYHSPRLAELHLGMPVLLIITACNCFILNTLSVALVVAMAERKPAWRVWHDCYFWCFPYYLGGSCVAWLIASLKQQLHWEASLLILPVLYFVYRSYRVYLDRLEYEKRHVEEIAGLHVRTIEALALAIEAKDQTTHDHLRRVRIYAIEIGKELGLSEPELEALRAAALLHDIGKLAVPEHIISKPGKLTPEEFEKMKIHPVVGAEILERVQFPYPVVPIVRCHHEKWDGTGYPSGLKGEEIPVGARILSVVDCLDALASDRQYRKALPLAKAMDIVRAEAGKSFDPRVVRILDARHVELEQQATNHQQQSATRLSTEVKIARGLAPARGFENPATDFYLSGRNDPMSSIAAARQEVQMLFELTQDIGRSLSVSETLSVVGVRLKRLAPYESIAVYIRKDTKLVPAFVNGENFRLFSTLEIPIGQGLSGWVADNNKPILNGNPSVEAGYLSDLTKFSTLRSALAVPLQGLNGNLGVLAIYRAEKDAFSREDLRILLAVGSKLAMSLENALLYQTVERSATTDYMTNLPNARSLFMRLENELSRCKRTGVPFAVMVCDLDGFKQINDRFGHLEGNKILRYVAHKLREGCREYDYVARMGGDEFVLLLPGVTAETAAARIADFRNAITEAVDLLPEPCSLSMSVGASYFPLDSAEAEELLSTADLRMYKSKRRQHREEPAISLPPEEVGVLPLTYK
jgi:diguanylate cyclase (GGDEF)-like protein/putative nucleotidyltransferase with HDIG domain